MLVWLVTFSTFAGLISVEFAQANPYEYAGEVPPKPDTVPPKIYVSSPLNNSVCYIDSVNLKFNVAGPTGPTVHSSYLENISYKADWLSKNVSLYTRRSWYIYQGTNVRTYSINENLTGFDEGKHNITLYITYHGTYIPGNIPQT